MICEFVMGHVYHVIKILESDGFYRRGTTFCGRFVDEKIDALEIAESSPQRPLCKKCKTEADRNSYPNYFQK